MLLLRVAVHAAGHDGHAAGASDILDAAVDGREELIGDVLDEQPDGGRALVGAAQVARGEVGPVVQLGRRLVDPGDELGAHPRLVVDHPGDGLQAHPGQGGDIAHGGPATVGGRPVRGPGFAPRGAR